MNIILISMDTQRADRMSCYGHFRLTTPHADKLAADGVLFERFYSPHIPTFPGHTTMMTGRDVYAHQITGQSGTPELSADIPMLAEILSANGYFTAAADNLGRWFTRGFQMVETYDWDKTNKKEWRKGEAVNAAALKVLNGAASQDKPFFLFLHYWDAHTPYLPPAPFSRMFYEGDEFARDKSSMEPVWQFENFKWYFHEWMPGVTDIEFPKAQYDAELAYGDAGLAHVFSRLEELKLVDDTLVVYTADHGEELDEHGCWFDHHGLYMPNIHIPFIMRLPGKIPAGKRISKIAKMPDVTPTILDYAGLLDSTLEFEGMSLRRLIEKPEHEDEIEIEDESQHPTPNTQHPLLHLTENTWMKKRAVMTEKWKLITALEPDIHGFAAVELYDLENDPGEKHNLAEERSEVVVELSAQMHDHVSRRTSQTGLPDPLPMQPIPLKRIGKMETAVPRDEQTDRKIAEGDFKGYERNR